MTTLVTGATGNVGRRLVEQLTGAGHKVRALSRHPDRATFPPGVEAVRGDLTDPASMEAAFEGTTRLHLLAAHGPSYETLPFDRAAELLAAARRAGVERVTVLWNGFRSGVEEAVEVSGLEWTQLHAGSFMSNDLQWAEEIRSEGTVREPFASVPHHMIHEADVAAVAAAALTEDGHGGKAHRLVGPEALAPPQRVALIGQALGRQIRYDELSYEQARERMIASGVDAESADFVLGWTADPANDRELAHGAADIEAIIGRPALTYARWAQDRATDFS